jgi:hypothetical protein
MDPRNCGQCPYCAVGNYRHCIYASEMKQEFVDTEQHGFLLDDAIERDDQVAVVILHMAAGKPTVPVNIGSKHTPRYRGHMDRESGVYWELNAPVMDDMWLLQLALTPHLLDRARARVKLLRQGKT